MKNILGPPVYGKNFKFREKPLKKGIRLLENKSSFLLLGIRRTGKSSFLKQVAYMIKTEGHKDQVCLEVECAQYQTMLEFYKGIYLSMPKTLQVKFAKFISDSRQLPKRIIDFVTDSIESIGVGEAKIDFSDKEMSYTAPFEKVIAEYFKESKNVYLFLDELPFFFENLKDKKGGIGEITRVLTNLRSWRDGGLPMGITGSLNLHQQLDNLGISRKLLAGLNTIELDAFTREESEALIDALRESENCTWWTPEITKSLLDLMPDYIPYFLQYSFNELVVQECTTSGCVEEVYHNEIMSGLFRDFIYQFDERLGVFENEKLNSAMLLLDAVAINEDIKLTSLQDKLATDFDYEVLIKLIDHEFLKISGKQEYSFGLQIIKNWWITKRGLN